MAGHQPKELTELAFASFTEYMKNKALQLPNQKDSPTSKDEATKTCRELKDFFHGTRLPPVLANEITKRLLLQLDMFSSDDEYDEEVYCRRNILSLVEVFLHPDVTSIELGSSYLYATDGDFDNFISKMILLQVASLHNLKTLDLELGFNTSLEEVKLDLPSQLEELTLCGSLCSHNDNVKSVVECCRELKSLKIMRCCIADTSVPHLLKLNRLETLHLLGDDGYGLDAACRAVINGISTDTTSDFLSASTLKSFGIELRDENTLHLVVDKLPHLTEIVLQLKNEFELSCLTRLKNLRSLTLDAGGRTSDDYKKILPVLGKSLVSLDLQCYKSLDLEFIGETCSNLQCLHVASIGSVSAVRPKPSLKSFPNFRTVQCLKVKMYNDYGWIEFLIVQCVNIKVLSVFYDFRKAKIIENVLKRTSLTNLEEIHCYREEIIYNNCLEELCLKCPNLRLVHGLESDSCISGRVVFDLYGCRKSLCKSYCYSLDCLDAVFGDENDDFEKGYPYTFNFKNYYVSDSE